MTPRPSWIRSRRAAVLLVVVLVAITGGVATAATLLLSSKTLTTGTKSVSVPLFQPTLTAVANPSATTTPGASLSDVAALSNGTTGATGFIVYKLFGPGNATCTGAPVASPSVAVTGNANYTASPAPAPTALGTYQWTVGYVGDSKNSPAPNPTPTCGNGGSVVLTASDTTPPNLTITSCAASSSPSNSVTCSGGYGFATGDVATVTVLFCKNNTAAPNGDCAAADQWKAPFSATLNTTTHTWSGNTGTIGSGKTVWTEVKQSDSAGNLARVWSSTSTSS